MATPTPKFITWKKYGFRHIIDTDRKREFRIVGYTNYYALCGNTYDDIHLKIALDPTYGKPYDPYDERRPLCGACKKAWKKATGNEVN